VYVRQSPDPMSSVWAWLAYDLRFYRERAGLSGTEMGKILGCVRSTVSRLESGELKPDEKQTQVIDDYFGTGGHFLRLLTYAKLGHDPDWFKQFTEYEARASMIQTYDGQLVPGLLQTPEYARALLIAGRDPNVDRSLEARMARQEILLKPNPPELWVLVAETVLAPVVGSAEVMRAQLARFLEISEQPNVILRVVPNSAGANAGLDGPFKVIMVAERDLAFVEAPGGGRLILGSSEVRAFRLRYDRIGADALSRDASRSLIAQLMETMK
jgi:transcriptional regulator with XRE-family HTH domain